MPAGVYFVLFVLGLQIAVVMTRGALFFPEHNCFDWFANDRFPHSFGPLVIEEQRVVIWPKGALEPIVPTIHEVTQWKINIVFLVGRADEQVGNAEIGQEAFGPERNHARSVL